MTLEPSRGGIGRRLKSIRPRFIMMKVFVASTRIFRVARWVGAALGASMAMVFSINMPRMASSMFEMGPARATDIIARLGMRKLRGSTCTGFAQPKFAKRSIRVPVKSRCLTGFRLSRPIFRGVGSPRKSATRAWAYSCTVRAMRMLGSMRSFVRMEARRLERPTNTRVTSSPTRRMLANQSRRVVKISGLSLGFGVLNLYIRV